MPDSENVQRWRGIALAAVQDMQPRRAALAGIDRHAEDAWRSTQAVIFDSVLSDARVALAALPEVQAELGKGKMCCTLPNGEQFCIALRHLGRGIWIEVASSHGGNPYAEPIALPRRATDEMSKFFRGPREVYSARLADYVRTEYSRRIESFIKRVASSVAIYRWEREDGIEE